MTRPLYQPLRLSRRNPWIKLSLSSEIFLERYNYSLSIQSRSFTQSVHCSNEDASISTYLEGGKQNEIPGSKAFSPNPRSKAFIDKIIQKSSQVIDLPVRSKDIISTIGKEKSSRLLRLAILANSNTSDSGTDSYLASQEFLTKANLMMRQLALEAPKGHQSPTLPQIRDPWLRALALELNQLGLSGKDLFDIEDYMVENNHRLEHVGDGLLYGVIRIILYDEFSDFSPSWSSKVSSLLVSNDVLRHLWDLSGLDFARTEALDSIWTQWDKDAKAAFIEKIEAESIQSTSRNPKLVKILIESLKSDGQASSDGEKPVWKELAGHKKADNFEAYCAALILSERTLDGKENQGFPILLSWLRVLYSPIIHTLKNQMESLQAGREIPKDKLKIHVLSTELSKDYNKNERYLTDAAKLRRKNEAKRRKEEREKLGILAVGLNLWRRLREWRLKTSLPWLK